MKNVALFVKLRRLVKSLAVSLFILLFGVAVTAFRSSASDDNDDKKKASKDSIEAKDEFKSLISEGSFDASKPYVTQLNPKAVPFVQDYIEKRGSDLEKMKIWGKPYFDMYDDILTSYGLPKELKYLSVIESHLAPNLVSIAGAVGPWQIMASEARRMGLTVNGRVDERKNYKKSTHAASKILKELHGQFKDWILVIAAYNCGQGRMRQAIRKAGSTNFWDLQAYLPLETRNHVKKFIGTHYLFEGSGGLTTMTASELQEAKLNAVVNQSRHLPIHINEATNTNTVEVTGRYKASVIAKVIGLELSLFNKLNPNFDKLVSLGNTYTLRLPVDKLIAFNNRKSVILQESLNAILNNTASALGK